jgi:hypothetical protein
MPYAFIPFIAIIVIGFPVALLARAATKRRGAVVSDFAAQDGWQEPVPGAALPGPVAAASQSRRSQLTFGKQFGPHHIWMNWHHWTETRSFAGGDGATQTTSKVHNLTRYFLALGPGGYPDLSFKRRTALGSVLRPVRGEGTGDAAFDRAFIVICDDRSTADRLLSARLREAMRTKAIPRWSIQQGTLVTAYDDRPAAANLDSRADTLISIGQMLA